jgi:hypothetical protein
MTVYGDDEPEDAWDPGDPFGLLVDNLFRRLALLEQEPASYNRRELLDILEARLSRIRFMRGLLDRQAQVRLDQLSEDLAFLRTRL